MNLIDEANKAYADLRADPAAWAEVQAERELWDVTLLDGLEEEDMSEESNMSERKLKIETVTRRFGEAAARLIAEVREAEGDDRRALITGISKAAMAEGVDAEAAGALAHLINTHGQ